MVSVNAPVEGWPAFAALMAGISIAVERLVEMVKGAVPVLANKWQAHDQVRSALLQLIATAFGALIATQMPNQVTRALPSGLSLTELHWPGYALLGLLSSAGSGVWNHALDILGAFKLKQEASSLVAQVNAAAPRLITGDPQTAIAVPETASSKMAPASSAAKPVLPALEPPVQKQPLAMAVAAGGGTPGVASPPVVATLSAPLVATSAPVASAPAYPGTVVAIGCQDTELVKLIQHRLNALGCGPLIEDGDFGAATQAAVELFQMRSPDHFGLPLRVDGRVGPLTWASLFALPQIQVEQTAPTKLLGEVLRIAGTQVGVMEVPLGSNRGPQVDQYLRSVGIDPATGSYPWCAAFVYWCFRQAAVSLVTSNPVVKTASVAEHWEKAGAEGIPRLTTAMCEENSSLVKPGMIFVIMNSAGTGHTGLVEGITGTYLTTIEGNTNDNGSREGIGVFRRNKRTISDINRGFIYY